MDDTSPGHTPKMPSENDLQNDRPFKGPGTAARTTTDDEAAAFWASKPSGVNRFRKAAINVLSKVLESKHEDQDDPEDDAPVFSPEIQSKSWNPNGQQPSISRSVSVPDGPRERHPTKHRSYSLTQQLSIENRRKKPSRRSTLPSLVEDQTDSPPAPRTKAKAKTRTPSLVSILGLMTFRKLYVAKIRKDEERQRRASVVASESVDDVSPRISQRRIYTPFLPAVPRFAATLSSEAQLATFKGYEDAVIDRLENTFPTKSNYHWRDLRSKTPKAPVVLTMDENGSRCTTAKKRPTGNTNPVFEQDSELRGSRPALIAASDSKCPRANKKLKKQLRVTYRLEYAMDMLDAMNEEMGEVALSPRRKHLRRNVDPVENCEDWIQGWTKEFVPSGMKQ